MCVPATPFPEEADLATVTHVFVPYRLSYCFIQALHGLPLKSVNQLQLMPNATFRYQLYEPGYFVLAPDSFLGKIQSVGN